MTNKELDRWIAEKVMEWEATYPDRFSGDHFSAHGDQFRYGLAKAKYPNGLEEHEWTPTTSISQAFEVVEKMRELGWGFVLHSSYLPSGTHVRFWYYLKEYESKAHAETPALAICKAVYEAVKGGK